MIEGKVVRLTKEQAHIENVLAMNTNLEMIEGTLDDLIRKQENILAEQERQQKEWAERHCEQEKELRDRGIYQ